MSQEFFEYHLDALKEKYSSFRGYQDYHVFTFLCIKYFFYSEAGSPFDPDIISEYLTDGKDDGGIDAILMILPVKIMTLLLCKANFMNILI